METFKNIAVSIVLGIVIVAISSWLRSSFLDSFFGETLIVVLVSLWAINTATTSVIMTKLREISDVSGQDFSKSISQLKLAMKEQVGVVISGFVLSILKSSSLWASAWPQHGFVMDTLLSATFIYAILVLFDLAQSVFVILNYEKTSEQ